jgi:sugar O-acyltransferase, sialic acid O-acetyltransferase NeuD family
MIPDKPEVDRFYIYGAKGFAVQVWLSLLAAKSGIASKMQGFIDTVDEESRTLCDFPIFHSESVLYEKGGQVACFLGFGAHQPRIKLFEKLRKENIVFPNVIHPSAVVMSPVKENFGIYIGAQAVVDPLCQIGFGCLINHHVVVSHESSLGDYVQLCPHVSVTGRCRCDQGVFVGTNATLVPDRKIGANSVVGANSLVLRDIPDNTLVYGSPAAPPKSESSR